MSRIIFVLGIVILISGCAGPRYSGTSIPSDILAQDPEILSINDHETRDSFQYAVEKWLADNRYTYVVKPEYSRYDPEKVTIEYVGYWSWDIALYLSSAEVEAFYKGKSVSKVIFKAPNSLNTNKWGVAEARIGLMLDILFGKLTAQEATEEL